MWRPAVADLLTVLGLLSLGFLFGMRHALDADHVAAVSSMTCGETSVRRIATRGAAWGAGHTLTLLAIAGLGLAFGVVVGPRAETAMEITVGVMLVALGGQVLWRLRTDRVHVHVHRHGARAHLHAHAHRADPALHDASDHDHEHPDRPPIRALAVGMVHGAAGSSALLLLTVATVASPVTGLLYVLVFGVGSIVGMTALSIVIAVPLRWSTTVAGAHRALQGAVGAASVALGGWIVTTGLS